MYTLTGILSIILGVITIKQDGDILPLLGIPLCVFGLGSFVYGVLPLLSTLN